ncbi:hypothetical protein LTS18_006156 [Coniosporium uncinatum]|uniref:Uncharacterized protein n=1 Tax=Coniosporium uncinatum TaxID=93489 RepID=A0ACC3D482_9PEZI|nr:hypothetical protein LTS18_006156 [Coniosporium uncinatum]
MKNALYCTLVPEPLNRWLGSIRAHSNQYDLSKVSYNRESPHVPGHTSVGFPRSPSSPPASPAHHIVDEVLNVAAPVACFRRWAKNP